MTKLNFSAKGVIPVLAAAIVFFAVSCDKGNNLVNNDSKGSYVIAASGDDVANPSYLLQTGKLDSGELSIVNSGLETETGTAWLFYNNKYLYRLVYNQGNAGTGSSYIINKDGQIEERSIKFEITNRFTTYGFYGKHIITAAAGATDKKDESGNIRQGVTFTILDMEAQTLKTKTVSTENFLGTGEYTTFSGIVDVNGKLFTAVCPIGVSAYGVAQGAADTTATVTAYPDSVWVAIYSNTDFENPKIIRDNRLSYASSRYRSQYYSNIVADDRNNIYVFSSSYDNRTTKPSGVIRIKAGTEVFDDYYFNIQAAAGGRHLFKVWYISEDYFLLQMYTTETVAAMGDAKRLAIFNAADKTLKEVTGLPAIENIGSFGSTPYVENGTVYMPVVPTEGSQPAIYAINASTAAATKGVVVRCKSISAVGKLIP
ncbi:MAG: DUF4374 domain-containing protein [Bacteroidales bacterium]|jgi:hypothetical protein|nr:DUF4374 domain-containing protein [Bacteroidales bacterium]